LFLAKKCYNLIKVPVMRGLKYIVLVLLVVGLLASSSCGLFKSSDGSNAQGTPIDPNWQPVYIDEARGADLDTDAFVQNVAPTVVAIVTEKISRDIFFQPVPQVGAGSGVVIDPKGYIVTNNHVVEGATSIEVTLSDKRVFKAIKVATDPLTDLAVVQINPEGGIPYAHFLSNSLTKLKVLQRVVAVGNALALPGGPTWTEGVVSYLGRAIQLENNVVLEDLIQTDAAINPGNSGGPLFNMAGQVVGINVAIAAEAQNIGFAISTDTVIPVVYSLITKQSVAAAWLGVSIYTVTPTIKSQYSLAVDSGAFIVQVVSGSPAEAAGLKESDVIVQLGGQAIASADQISAAIKGHQPGDAVQITFWRGNEKMSTTATLRQRPSS